MRKMDLSSDRLEVVRSFEGQNLGPFSALIEEVQEERSEAISTRCIFITNGGGLMVKLI